MLGRLVVALGASDHEKDQIAAAIKIEALGRVLDSGGGDFPHGDTLLRLARCLPTVTDDELQALESVLVLCQRADSGRGGSA